MARKKRIFDYGEIEAEIVAKLWHKLEALFQHQVKKTEKENNHKSKDKGGEKKVSRHPKKTSVTSIRYIKSEIAEYLATYRVGIPHTKLKNQPELSREQSSLINIDFEGLYFTPKSDELSGVYKAAKMAATKYDVCDIYQISDYNLNEIPCWAEMKKFNSFRPMYRNICRQLSKIGFNPSNLNQLGYSDVIDIVAHHNREHPEQRLIGQRSRFLKMFAACYGEEFVNKMSLIGRDRDEKQKNEQLAKNFLTYVYYMDNPSKKAPKECASAANYFSVHHTQNRKYANEMEDYSSVNNFSNLVLCISRPHHTILHTPQEIDLDRNVVFFGGFLQEFRISRDPQKERDYENNLIREFRPQRGGGR